MTFEDITSGDRPFNMAVATLQRIHLILVSLNRFSMEGIQDRRYFRLLLALSKEVQPFLSDKEKATLNKYYTSHWDYLVCLERMQNITPDMRLKNSIRKNVPDFYGFELFMREQLYKHDLIMPRHQDPRNAMGGTD